jgi:putative SOS response-associated peptidase YedK
MCYSALVRQDIHELARRYGAEIAYEMFAELFRRRLDGDDIKATRALEQNFANPKSAIEEGIKASIDAYRASQVSKWETDLFVQKKRVADAERSLQTKETKKARDDVRIATNKIQTYMDRLSDVRRTAPEERDTRIFPMTYAPVLANIDGRLQVVPMRYTCRLGGKPANYDVRYPGAYNARRDNLEGFWKAVYGRNHALMVVSGFYENVPRHLYERRELKPAEKPANVVLRFNPRPVTEMLVACLWDRWSGPSAPDLWSFAAITDEPPPEIAETGHQRCIIALRQANVREWLSPEAVSRDRLEVMLGDKEMPYYEHRVAA